MVTWRQVVGEKKLGGRKGRKIFPLKKLRAMDQATRYLKSDATRAHMVMAMHLS